MVEEEGHVDEPLAVDSYQVCCVPNCHGLPGFAGQPHTFLVHRRSHSSLKAKAYFILDEFLLAGEGQETSKKCVLNAIKLQVRTGGYGGSTALQDFVMEEETPQGVFEEAGLG